MNIPFIKKQIGFTLVELLVVMLILTALASVTLDFTKDFAFQGRYEVTKDRYEKIKRAIIGRPDVLINGQPDISGFVADVGRLPNNLHELLEDEFCSQRWKLVSGVKVYYETSGACTTDGGTWNSITGWKGPYLTVKNDPLHDDAFNDGWANQDSTLNQYCSDPLILDETLCTDAGKTWHEGAAGQNYGWSFTKTATEISLQSLGKDQAGGGSDYDADYPGNQTAVRQNDWKIDLNEFPLRILASSVSGSCAVTATDPATCSSIGGSWVTGTCSGETISTSDECVLLGGTWDSVNSICPSGYSISTSAACSLVGGSWAAGDTCSSPIDPTTKLACLSAGGDWTHDPTNNLCLKIINQTQSISSSLSQTIIEDGTSQVVHFPYASTAFVAPGEVIGLLYSDASCTGSVTYGSTHANNICINTADDADFTKVNCQTAIGNWIEVGGEQYCRNVVGTTCTDTAGANLGGTEHPSISAILLPHSILPTVTW